MYAENKVKIEEHNNRLGQVIAHEGPELHPLGARLRYVKNLQYGLGQAIATGLGSMTEWTGYILGVMQRRRDEIMAERGYEPAFGETVTGTDNFVYKAGTWIKEFAKDTWPTDPARRDELGAMMAQGIGSALLYYGPATAAKLASMSTPKILALTSMMSGATLGEI